MSRFVKDNAHLQLLCNFPHASPDVTSVFSHAVLDQACAFTSTQHLDSLSQDQSLSFIPAKKYTIATFTESEMELLTNVYFQLHPSFNQQDGVYFPRSYKKMLHVTVKGQKVSAGQYILARSIFRFPMLLLI